MDKNDSDLSQRLSAIEDQLREFKQQMKHLSFSSQNKLKNLVDQMDSTLKQMSQNKERIIEQIEIIDREVKEKEQQNN